MSFDTCYIVIKVLQCFKRKKTLKPSIRHLSPILKAYSLACRYIYAFLRYNLSYMTSILGVWKESRLSVSLIIILIRKYSYFWNSKYLLFVQVFVFPVSSENYTYCCILILNYLSLVLTSHLPSINAWKNSKLTKKIYVFAKKKRKSLPFDSHSYVLWINFARIFASWHLVLVFVSKYVVLIRKF